MRILRSFALATLVAALASCSFIDRFDRYKVSDDAGPDLDAHVNPPLTVETFLPLFFDGLCTKAIRCESKLGIGGLLELYCHPGLREVFLSSAFGENIVGFEPTAAQTCLDQLASIDCSISNTLFADACETVVSGNGSPTIANGSACISDAQCIDGRCEEMDTICGSVCVDRGAVGATCTSLTSDDECDAGLRCRGGLCQVPGQIGDVCERAGDCTTLTWCDPDTLTCQPLPNSGDSCVNGAPTDYSDPCRGSLVCALVPADGGPDTFTCRPGGTAGATCSDDAPCGPSHRCRSNVCHLISPPGGSCISRDDCPTTFECVAEVCVPFADLGQACSPTLPCTRGGCVGGFCTLLADGAVCDGSNGLLGGQCAGYCDTSAGTPYHCAARNAAGVTCAGAYDDESCLPSHECVDSGGGSFQCTSCP